MLVKGIMYIEGIIIISKKKIANKLPYAEITTASCPRPSFNNSCHGRIESSVSVSGHPRKIEGIKSTKVWVIAIDVINTTK